MVSCMVVTVRGSCYRYEVFFLRRMGKRHGAQLVGPVIEISPNTEGSDLINGFIHWVIHSWMAPTIRWRKVVSESWLEEVGDREHASADKKNMSYPQSL